MKIVLLVTLLLVTLNARQLSHLGTTYQTCCPDTYVLEPT
jgi:hypothetical protein